MTYFLEAVPIQSLVEPLGMDCAVLHRVDVDDGQ